MRLYSFQGACLFLALSTGVLSGGPLSSPSPVRDCSAAAAAAAAPGQENPCGGAQSHFQPTYTEQVYCGASTLVNHTLTDSPTLADCQALLVNTTGSPGYWTVSHWPGDSVLSPMLTNGTCQLVIGKIGEDLTQNATIGNKDIENFVNLMISQLNGTCSQAGRCSAWGLTNCYSSAGVDVAISWEFLQPEP
ncbi:hypothetical protein PG993_013307 [Apiospora rasikravindrae]|uniref:Ecp2 effector protein-like domain-containing protein n=1 Tax=Apiospora rasikravindrae TaxID=990691 RepID=A0ABR1RX99_9PEZI